MRKTTKILVLVVAMVTAVSLSFPAEVHAQHFYGNGYGHGYGHDYGHGYGHGYGYGGYGPYGNGYFNDGAVRIEVSPKESRKEIQVFVDGGTPVSSMTSTGSFKGFIFLWENTM